MATIDEIFDTMPEGAYMPYEELEIDAVSRVIFIPESELVFGVESDTQSERKHFRCPRYVGNGLDLASCFLRINFRNANGEVDSYLVDDVAIDGTDITFSWELWTKVTAYKGKVQFIVCAIMGDGFPEWNTTVAAGNVLEGLETDTSAAEAESADVITQLISMVKAQTSAVEAVGTAQCDVVREVGEATAAEAKASIEAKGAAVVASIPPDYTALTKTVDNLTRDRAAAIVCEAEGETIQVNDASADPIAGLRVFGKSTQDGTPTPEAPVEIVSAKAPVVTVYGKNLCNMKAFNSMGSNGTSNIYDTETHTITLVTDAVSISGRYGSPVKVLPVGKKCTVSFDVRGTTGRIVKCGWDKMKTAITLTDAYKRYSSSMVITVETEPISFYTETASQGGLRSGEYMQFENVQVEYGDVATDYEEYLPPQPLATTHSLPGIPVTTGGNYTDANGQQWIADEVDFTRGVYVRRLFMKTITDFTKANSYSYDGTGTSCAVIIDENVAMHTALCSHFVIAHKATNIERFNLVDKTIYFKLSGELSWEKWVEQMTELSPTIIGVLITPVETPLTTEEIEAFKALLANKPTTTVLNDAGAWMKLEYAADPKLYIDNKIAAILAAK